MQTFQISYFPFFVDHLRAAKTANAAHFSTPIQHYMSAQNTILKFEIQFDKQFLVDNITFLEYCLMYIQQFDEILNTDLSIDQVEPYNCLEFKCPEPEKDTLEHISEYGQIMVNQNEIRRFQMQHSQINTIQKWITFKPPLRNYKKILAIGQHAKRAYGPDLGNNFGLINSPRYIAFIPQGWFQQINDSCCFFLVYSI